MQIDGPMCAKCGNLVACIRNKEFAQDRSWKLGHWYCLACGTEDDRLEPETSPAWPRVYARLACASFGAAVLSCGTVVALGFEKAGMDRTARTIGTGCAQGFAELSVWVGEAAR